MKLRNQIIIVVIGGLLSIFALTYGIRINWPDYVHVRYGFPLVWGIHTLVTIIGPVDVWEVNLKNLLIDLITWLIVILAPTIFFLVRKGSE